MSFKSKKGSEEARKIPSIDGWMKSLGKDTQKKAEKLFGHINKIKVSPDEKKNLFKNSVLTFEHLRCKD
ncbi:MAG: ATP-binding protein, partial [Gammaproteobacteria bacterium]|nr:ATP-binding protein [Gammaproteobacteria bacterium]